MRPGDMSTMNERMRKLLARGCAGVMVVLASGCTAMTGPNPGEPEYATVAPPTARPQVQNNGAIYQAGHEMVLFEDVKARRIGDTLTVLLQERTDATKSANSAASKDSSASLAVPRGFGEHAVDSGSEFDGGGSADQSNQLQGQITVTVTEVLPNGNLVIQGEKWIGINQGREFIRLRGIVRSVDIRPDNTVLSERVADARIAYGGEGMIADTNRAGWLTRFFQSPLWPF